MNLRINKDDHLLRRQRHHLTDNLQSILLLYDRCVISILFIISKVKSSVMLLEAMVILESVFLFSENDNF